MGDRTRVKFRIWGSRLSYSIARPAAQNHQQSLAQPAAELQGQQHGRCKQLYEIFRPYDLGSFASNSLSDHRPLSCESFLACLVRDDLRDRADGDTIYSCDCRRWDGYCKAEGTGMRDGVASVVFYNLPCSKL